MSEIKTIITEQLQQLQILMHRTSFHNFMGDGRSRSPHRGQGRILALLILKPEISQRELTFLSGMSKQSLAELLAKLEKSGYITRESSEEDKRVMEIKLTEEGSKAAADVGSDTLEAEKPLDCLDEEELAAFSEYLGRIIRRYEEQFPDDDFDQRRKMMEEFMLLHKQGFGGHGRHHGGHGFHGFGGFDGCGRHHGGHEEQSADDDFEQHRKMMEEFVSSHRQGFGGHGRHHGGRGFHGLGGFSDCDRHHGGHDDDLFGAR
ncbi:MAG: MarR family transcriptional regulator [Synergistaceae bacterium]|jgi:DNA-binding MarR family transcriptional regulator|nr:MarR family transcriptional regulator [Synergistaceae bacterium]